MTGQKLGTNQKVPRGLKMTQKIVTLHGMATKRKLMDQAAAMRPRLMTARKMATVLKKVTKRKGITKSKMGIRMMMVLLQMIGRMVLVELCLGKSTEKDKMETIKKKLVTEMMINAEKRMKISKQVL